MYVFLEELFSSTENFGIEGVISAILILVFVQFLSWIHKKRSKSD